MRSVARRSTCTRSSAGGWWTGCSRPRGRSARIRWSSSPRPDRRAPSTGLDVAVQERAARHRRRRPLRPRGASADADEVLVLSGDTPLLTTELLARSARRAPRRGRGGDGALVRPDDMLQLRPGRSATTRAISRRSSRPPTRRRSSSRSREANSSIYVFRADALWPALEQLEPANAQGELYLTDAVRGIVESGNARRGARRARSRRDGGRQHARRARRSQATALRDRINRAHMLAGVTIVDPRSTWIEPTVTLEPDSSSIRSRFSAARRPSRPARRSGRTRWSSTRRSDAMPSSGRSVTFAPAPCSSPRRRQARSWSSRTPSSARAPRCLTSPTWATPTSARARTSGAGSITANLSHHPEKGKSRTTDRP